MDVAFLFFLTRDSRSPIPSSGLRIATWTCPGARTNSTVFVVAIVYQVKNAIGVRRDASGRAPLRSVRPMVPVAQARVLVSRVTADQAE